MKENAYERIAEFFYGRASARIKQAVKDSKLKYADILPTDSKQISRIINNSRQRNNPYLINDSALNCFVKDDTTGKGIPFGLVPRLGFSSNKDVLWGRDAEIHLYIHDLFMLLWEEVCINRKLIVTELYLCDYIPYAKYHTYWEILFEPDPTNDPRFSFFDSNREKLNPQIEPFIYSYFSSDNYERLSIPAILFGIKEDTVIENIGPARRDALEFFYNRCKNDFLTNFIEFAEANDSFHMLNRVIKDDLVEKRFLPLMEKYKPNASSLGLRVKNLIYEDLSYSAALIRNHDIDNPDYRKQLINASSDYILRLERIQQIIGTKRTELT